MSEAAASDPAQSLHEEIAAVQKDLGAQVHQVKSEVGQMRAEMRQEMAELRKEMREVMACIGQLMEKRSVRNHDARCPGRSATALCFAGSGQNMKTKQIDRGCMSPFVDSVYPVHSMVGVGGWVGVGVGGWDYSLPKYTVLTFVAFPHGGVQ